MTLRQVGLGVVGCGWAAGEIARAAAHLPRLRLVACHDSDPARAAAFSTATGARPAAGMDDILADPAVDAIYAGLPHHLLAPAVARALAAGRHVLAEKPLALAAEEASRLGAMAEARHLKLAVFFELRRASTVQRARELIGTGELGAPLLIRVRTVIDKRLDYWGSAGAPSWKASKAAAGGGVLLMNTIHQLDTLRYVTGLDYVRASGEIGTFFAPAEVEDAVSASLRLSNGALLCLAAAAHSPGARHEETIEIDCTFGRLDIPDPFGEAPLRIFRRSLGRWEDVPAPRRDSHAAMIDGFLDSVLDGAEVPAGAQDAAAALEAVSAIYGSAREGRAVDVGAGGTRPRTASAPDE